MKKKNPIIFAVFILVVIFAVLIWKQNENYVYAGSDGAWDSSVDSLDVAGWGYVAGDLFDERVDDRLDVVLKGGIGIELNYFDVNDSLVIATEILAKGKAAYAVGQLVDTLVIPGVTTSSVVIICPWTVLDGMHAGEPGIDTVWIRRTNNISGVESYSYVVWKP